MIFLAICVHVDFAVIVFLFCSYVMQKPNLTGCIMYRQERNIT